VLNQATDLYFIFALFFPIASLLSKLKYNPVLQQNIPDFSLRNDGLSGVWEISPVGRNDDLLGFFCGERGGGGASSSLPTPLPAGHSDRRAESHFNATH